MTPDALDPALNPEDSEIASGFRILIVEDDEGVNRLVRRCLERSGFRVHGVLTGKEGLACMERDPDQLLVLDLNLPDMSGTHLIVSLRKKGIDPVFIAVTGQGNETVAVELMKMGARDYIIKGFDLTERLPRDVMRVCRALTTERRLRTAEIELRESEEQFRTLFEQAAVGIARVAPDGRFLAVNQRLCDMLGYTREEMTRLTFREITHPADLHLDEQHVSEVLAGRKDAFDIEKRYIHKSDRELWVHLFSNVVRDEKGTVKYAIATVADMTAAKKAEKDRQRLQEQVHKTRKLDSIGRLAGGVAHDLNNLLSPVLGYTEMLLEDEQIHDFAKDALGEILKAGTRSRDLVKQLLAFSRRQALAFSPVDLNRLTAVFAKLLRRTIREDVKIDLKLARPLPMVMGDEGQLEQVIMNLAVNAQEAMPGGGMLTIETARASGEGKSAAAVSGDTPGTHVMLRVADTGCGMDDQTLKHLYEPFFSTKSEGTGLGLATVYGIVKQHNGIIDVRSVEGEGTAFKVFLPVASEIVRDKKEASAPPVSSPASNSETLLLVEDNPHVRGLAETVLKREGYTVLTARNGREGVAVFDGHDGPVHLLVSDVIMPGMNGRQLHEALSDRDPDIRVLFMSGYTDEVISHHGILEPGIHFIQKPFDIGRLTAKVRAVLDGVSPDETGAENQGESG